MGNSFSLSSYRLVIKVQRRKDMNRGVTDSLKVVHLEIHHRSGVDLKISLYMGGPKYFRNLNLPHKRDIVQGSATRCSEPMIF